MMLAAVLMAAAVSGAPSLPTPLRRLPPLADSKVDLNAILSESDRTRAEAGDGPAMLRLGSGLINSSQRAEGMDWLRRALERRAPGAAATLAGAYFDPEAPAGHLSLGMLLYPTCQASSASPALGVGALQIGAANGDGQAMITLAHNQLFSPCTHDPVAAVGWLEKAADLGRVQAMVDLTELYAKGEQVKRDLVKARAWRKRALASGGLFFDPMVGVSLFAKDPSAGGYARLECHEHGDLGKIVNPNPIRGLHPQTLSCYWP